MVAWLAIAGRCREWIPLSFHSSCVDAGTSDGVPATDIEGIARPQGAGVDIGAHELWYLKIYLPVILRGSGGG